MVDRKGPCEPVKVVEWLGGLSLSECGAKFVCHWSRLHKCPFMLILAGFQGWVDAWSHDWCADNLSARVFDTTDGPLSGGPQLCDIELNCVHEAAWMCVWDWCRQNVRNDKLVKLVSWIMVSSKDWVATTYVHYLGALGSMSLVWCSKEWVLFKTSSSVSVLQLQVFL